MGLSFLQIYLEKNIMGWTDDAYDDTPEDDWNEDFNEELQHSVDLADPSYTETGFTARHEDNLLSDRQYADSDFLVEEDGSIRERTGTEKLFRDYGLYIGIIGGFFALKVL